MLSLETCRLCPRCCGVNRTQGARGYCGAGILAEVFRYGRHTGEEPPVSGSRGSGTVFFSRCTMRCIYCQNFPWSQMGQGRMYDEEALAAVFCELQEMGCHNVNLVSPTPWWLQIRAAVQRATKNGFRLPLVYNTSGFERVETLRDLAGEVAVYLTDLRYARASSATEGSDAGSYVETARAAAREMWRQVGPLEVDDDGVVKRGFICRLLVLPGRSAEAVDNLEWLARELGSGAAVSVMCQYVPAHRAVGRGEWGRVLGREEYARVCTAMEDLGFERGWVQDYDGNVPRELVGFEMKESMA